VATKTIVGSYSELNFRLFKSRLSKIMMVNEKKMVLFRHIDRQPTKDLETSIIAKRKVCYYSSPSPSEVGLLVTKMRLPPIYFGHHFEFEDYREGQNFGKYIANY
jgi:hypothetical protein